MVGTCLFSKRNDTENGWIVRRLSDYDQARLDGFAG